MEDMEAHSALISQDTANSHEQHVRTASFVTSTARSAPSDRTRAFEDEMIEQAAEDMPPSSSVLLQASEMFVDAVLLWPIFSKFAPHLTEELHRPIIQVLAQSSNGVVFGNETFNNSGSTLLHLDSDVLNDLVTNFLENNHIKNPILDVHTLWNYVSDFAESGPQWNARSCLVVSL